MRPPANHPVEKFEQRKNRLVQVEELDKRAASQLELNAVELLALAAEVAVVTHPSDPLNVIVSHEPTTGHRKARSGEEYAAASPVNDLNQWSLATGTSGWELEGLSVAL
jgi:hypothetical protein